MARKLGETLIDGGHISPRQLQEALRSQRVFGGTLGSCLLRLGYVDETTLLEALAGIHGVGYVTRRQLLATPPEVVALLPPEFARRHLALPFQVEGQTLDLALHNPSDPLAVHEAAFLTGFDVVGFVALESALTEAIAHHHGSSSPPARDDASAGANREAEPAPAEASVTTGPLAVSATERGETSKTGPSAGASAPGPDGASAGASSGPGEAPPPSRAFSETARALADARERDEVLSIALAQVGAWFPRALVFSVRHGEALPWRRQIGFERAVPATGFPLDVPSILSQAIERRKMEYGPLPGTAGNRELIERLGGIVPRIAYAAPVVVKDRVVLILYGDDPSPALPPPDLAHLRRLGLLVGWAIEALVLRRKILDAAR